MNTGSFLEAMSAIRHDFLNHLQVISGLVQLNKFDRVREYIKQVSLEMEKLSSVSRLVVPEVAAFLTAAHFMAGKHQVRVLYDIDTNMGNCPVPGEILAEALEEAFNQSLDCLAPPGAPDRCLKISVAEWDRKYLLKLSFPDPPCSKAETARERLAGVGRKMVAYGGNVEMVVSGGGGEILVVFPQKLPEEDSFGT